MDQQARMTPAITSVISAIPGSVLQFPGPEPHRAVFDPEGVTYLVERHQHADHFEVAFARLPTRPRIGRAARWWCRQWGNVVRDVPDNGWRMAAFC